MERNIKPTFMQLKSILAAFLLFCAFTMTGCSKEEDPAPKDSPEELRKAISGLYLGDGVYNQKTFDDQLITVSASAEKAAQVSSTNFPGFYLTDLYVGYRKSDTEYTVFAKAEAPHEGNVTIAFPSGEITIVAEIKVDETTKRTVTFTGVKQE